MAFRTPLNKVRFSQWADIMRQLRPSVTAEDIGNLVPWRYKIVTSLREDKVVGVGAYYPTASLIRGKFNYFADLVVDSKYRGKGIGAEMIGEVLHPNLACELDSGLEKVEAHHFYQTLGFAHTGYAVRPQVAVLAVMEDLPPQPTYLIDGATHLKAQDPTKQKQIQTFIDEHVPISVSYQVNLELFMVSNPDHRLLALYNEAGGLEGILLYELQNRLSFGGNCFHVTDLIVKDDSEASARQNTLLLALLQQAINWNSQERSAIKTVVVEMTEAEVNKHKLLNNSVASKSSDDKAASSTRININSFFSVSAKHFVKAAPTPDLLPLAKWHQKRTP